MNRTKLILASASPRRAELLQQAGIPFSVHPAYVEEVKANRESPRDYVARLAREKAAAVSTQHPQALCLAADTVVVFQDQVLEKPVDAADAERMLRLLSGTHHSVITGFCLQRGNRIMVEVVKTRVEFRHLSDQEITAYVQSGEPMDKAGGYGIQAGAAHMLKRIEGSYTNVVGLPMAEVVMALQLWMDEPQT